MANNERMISANKLVILLGKRFRNKGMVHYDDLMAAIADVPTVDAVEVLRCKDCKKWLKLEPSGTNCRVCDVTQRIRLPYDYCSYGERKDNGDQTDSI